VSFECLAKARVGCREGISLAHPQREVVRRPRPDAVERGERVDELLEPDAPVQPNRVVAHRLRERAHRTGAGAGQAEPCQVGIGEGCRAREEMAEPKLRETRHRRSELLDEPRGEGVGGGDADVLADDRAHSGLERIPRSGYAESGALLEERPDRRVVAQMARGLVEVEIEPGDPPAPVDDVRQLLPVGKVSAQDEVLVVSRQKLEHSRMAAEGERAP